MEQKAALRRAMKERLQKLSENERRVESAIIVRSLRERIGSKSQTVALYAPYIDEPNIIPLAHELIENNFVICMPLVNGRTMTMHRLRSMDAIVRNAVTNIPEPLEQSPVDERTIDLVLVPGRAFCTDGRRLGRGNGGYDTWIRKQRQQSPKTTCIGLCFDCQIMSDIPSEAHDERMDAVMTASKFYSVNM